MSDKCPSCGVEYVDHLGLIGTCQKVQVMREALVECIIAIHLTRQYVGEDMLPAIEGWSWYDATVKAEQALRGTGGTDGGAEG